MKNVFHPGELEVQERANERELAIQHAPMIGDTIAVGARAFLAQQRMLPIAGTDGEGRLWATIGFGPAGFATTSGARDLSIDRAAVANDDPVWANLAEGAPLGLLAIDLGSRRRYRINGIVTGVTAARVDVQVHEAYPNCPKYIQKRRLIDALAPPLDASVVTGCELDAERLHRIARADTVFVASRHPTRGHDVSHRGGEVGFVHVVDARTLRLPDYPGNGLFNTLGNFAVDDAAGLAVPDFLGGRLLQLTGRAKLAFGVEDPGHATGGTGRYWEFAVTAWRESGMPAARWELVDTSPYNPGP